MIIDRTHVRWGIGTAVATLLVTAVYLANNDPDVLGKWRDLIPLPAWIGPIPPRTGNIGATPLGLIYGTVALLIFIFAALLGARRNHSSFPLGPIKIWLKAHIWLTLFTVPLVVFHCGFHGGGPMTQFLLWLYGFVMISGIWGLILQNIVPRMMRQSLSEETIFEQIPFIREQLIAKAEAIRKSLPHEFEDEETVDNHSEGGTATHAVSHSPALATVIRFIDEEALPYLKGKTTRRTALSARETSENQFRLVKLQLPDFMHPSLDQLEELCNEKRRLDIQTRLHYWLHSWLIVHAPASLLLVVLTVVHAVVALFLYD